MPGDFDAWDVDIYHLETPTQLEAESTVMHMSGPLRAGVVTEYKFGKSTWKVVPKAGYIFRQLETDGF